MQNTEQQLRKRKLSELEQQRRDALNERAQQYQSAKPVKVVDPNFEAALEALLK